MGIERNGAQEANLPPSYIFLIEDVASTEDPDRARDAREREIYNGPA